MLQKGIGCFPVSEIEQVDVFLNWHACIWWVGPFYGPRHEELPKICDWIKGEIYT